MRLDATVLEYEIGYQHYFEEQSKIIMPVSIIAHFQMQARYNTGANHRLYDTCAQLETKDRTKNRRGFFRSIHGTLNHILVGDRIWRARFRGETVPSTSLDIELYKDFDELRTARESEDAAIETLFENLDDAFLRAEIHYRNNEGRELRVRERIPESEFH